MKAEARHWLRKSMQQYRALERLPTFSDTYRQNVRELEQTLERLQ